MVEGALQQAQRSWNMAQVHLLPMHIGVPEWASALLLATVSSLCESKYIHATSHPGWHAGGAAYGRRAAGGGGAHAGAGKA